MKTRRTVEARVEFLVDDWTRFETLHTDVCAVEPRWKAIPFRAFIAHCALVGRNMLTAQLHPPTPPPPPPPAPLHRRVAQAWRILIGRR